jgi:5-methylcytosine-specific restriction endonuclease McrA
MLRVTKPYRVVDHSGVVHEEDVQVGPQQDGMRAKNAPRSESREAIPERVRHEVWRRDQGRFVECGSRERLEYDHIIAVANGGSNTARNIELRCETCNRRKGARI